ncbi:FAD-dependent oxidoreductase [Nocardia vinacea]|uniref:ferredoxin--NADP(+) reductase n=1 Tax=Nocardia vinacea TaxID=96468 RepID=A0ABZ1YR58_9NOCA|nr:FAD-dependent oxidoreductase [Nocardia vinacea]
MRVAIVGAGPAGMYAAGHLLEGPGGTYLDGRLQELVDRPVEVDVFDRLPTQWGLLRHGVAPDHPEKKLVERVFEQTAARPGFRFRGNIEIGEHASTRELSDWYDAVIYAHGAAGDNRLGIEGEGLPGFLSARAFVAWFNGHPDYLHIEPNLSHERAVVIGNGNVALDVARILARPVDDLSATDIAEHALIALRGSRIREIVILGRRPHFNGAFHNPELEELEHLHDVDIEVDYGESSSDPDTQKVDSRRKIRTIRRYATRPKREAPRQIVLRFLSSPLEITGGDRVAGLLVGRNRLVRDQDGADRLRLTDDRELVETGLVLCATGYFGTPLPGLPYDEARGVVPNEHGRIVRDGNVVAGQYVTGWAKRGPRGIIGTNKKCARDTVVALLEDARHALLPTGGTRTAEEVETILRGRVPTIVDHTGWIRIDDSERRAGRKAGRSRHKIADRETLLRVAASK